MEAASLEADGGRVRGARRVGPGLLDGATLVEAGARRVGGEGKAVAAAEVGEPLALDELLHDRRAGQGVLLGELAVHPAAFGGHELRGPFDRHGRRCLQNQCGVTLDDDLDGRPVAGGARL